MGDESVPKTVEVVYYRGKRSGHDPIIKTLKATVLLAISIFILSRGFVHNIMDGIAEAMVDEPGGYKVWIWLIVFLTWLLYLIWTWWGWGTVRYVVTNRKITFERGRFAKTMKSIELWRIRDLIFQRRFLESLFGIGTITIVAKDLTGTFTAVGPISRAMRIYEDLNEARHQAIQERGVMAVES